MHNISFQEWLLEKSFMTNDSLINELNLISENDTFVIMPLLCEHFIDYMAKDIKSTIHIDTIKTMILTLLTKSFITNAQKSHVMKIFSCSERFWIHTDNSSLIFMKLDINEAFDHSAYKRPTQSL